MVNYVLVTIKLKAGRMLASLQSCYSTSSFPSLPKDKSITFSKTSSPERDLVFLFPFLIYSLS